MYDSNRRKNDELEWNHERYGIGRCYEESDAGRGQWRHDVLCAGQLAREQGLEDAAESFIEAANEEAVHAGFYAVLSGKYPSDFWGLVRGIQKAETNGEAQIKALADQVRAAGHAEAADQMEVFARQEGAHGVRLQKLLDKYQKNAEVPAGQKVYVCPVCGYEHVGDINAEDDSYVCPICGQRRAPSS